MEKLPRVKIKREPTASGRDWKRINKSVYDENPKAYELYQEKPKPKPAPEPEPDPFEDIGDTAEILKEAGFDSADKIREASDDDLRAVKGIGPAKLKEIRKVFN